MTEYLIYVWKYNPYAAGGLFGQYKMMQKPENPGTWVLI